MYSIFVAFLINSLYFYHIHALPQLLCDLLPLPYLANFVFSLIFLKNLSSLICAAHIPLDPTDLLLHCGKVLYVLSEGKSNHQTFPAVNSKSC